MDSGTPPTTERPSIGTLVGQLSEQASRLVRAEIDLAKAELTAKVTNAGIGIGLFVGAALFGFFTFAMVIATSVIALNHAVPDWLAALLVTVVLLLVTVILALVGKSRVSKGLPPTPELAQESIKKDVEAVKKSFGQDEPTVAVKVADDGTANAQAAKEGLTS